jgi:S-(hydroxymethyl)glutathione dehydrogenase / alcohol dehydrogenase
MTLPTVFHAAILRQLGKPLSIEEIEIPEILTRGQVLVQIAYSGVCRSQLMEVRGDRGADRWLPHMLGHEGTGIVVAVGEGVTKVGLGDKVILGWIRGSGIESGGGQLYSIHGIVNAGSVSTFSTHSIVSENRLVKIPNGLPLDIAVLFGCALPTGAGMVINELKPKPGSCVVVYGLGGIGLSALMATHLFDCKVLVAVDVSVEKLEMARLFGATHVVNSRETDVRHVIDELTEGKGADYCVESAGRIETIEQAFSLVRKNGGECLFASHPESGKKIQLDPHDLISGKRIQGSWGGGCLPDEDVPRLAKLYSQGRLPLERLIERRYRLDQINEALEDLEMGRVFRPLIEMKNVTH